MTKLEKKNLAASVRDRLLALARERGEDFQLLLTRYGLERLVYRLSQSPHRDRFILKGAMLFVIWSGVPHRTTRDIDFLGSGDNSQDGIAAVFRDLCAIRVQSDGVTFDGDSVRVEPIRDVTEYGGMRVTLTGELANARIPIQVDIGFGDVVTPGAIETDYPALLDQPAPKILAYPRETVIAEKYQAVVALGMANTRMKDFYDLWVIARCFEFDGKVLKQALKKTFARRRTGLPIGTPPGLSTDFSQDRQKNTQWNAFMAKTLVEVDPPSLADVCACLNAFLGPPAHAAVENRVFAEKWPPGGPWKRLVR